MTAKNDRNVTAAQARSTAASRVGAGERTTTFRIDPDIGRTFYQVITQEPAHRWLTWVDAGTGAVRKNIDTVAHGSGVGVKGDIKTIDTSAAPGGGFQLVSQDGRQATYDSGNKGSRGTIMTDSNDVWDLLTPPDASPSQPAGVDAHYYGNVVDDFYAAVFNRNRNATTGCRSSPACTTLDGQHSRVLRPAGWDGPHGLPRLVHRRGRWPTATRQ